MSNNLYQDRGSRLDTVVGEGKAYFEMLHKLHKSFTDHARGETKELEFPGWCERMHGFRPIYDESGGITPIPTITDPQKYTICLLKYTG